MRHIGQVHLSNVSYEEGYEMRTIVLEEGQSFDASLLERDSAFDAEALKAATDIVDTVRREGDAALRAYSERFDGVTLDELEVSEGGDRRRARDGRRGVPALDRICGR